VTNLHVSAPQVKSELALQWNANFPLQVVPQGRVAALVAEKYSQQNWNGRF
jgi:hypothetical protein